MKADLAGEAARANAGAIPFHVLDSLEQAQCDAHTLTKTLGFSAAGVVPVESPRRWLVWFVPLTRQERALLSTPTD